MPISHTVKPGDCISSIADQHGRFWQQLWDHADNAQLKDLRKDPNVLNPGDVVVIPDLQNHEESCATEQKHRFRRKGVPAKLKVRILRDDKPRAKLPYVLEIDSITVKGNTDGDGFVKGDIPPGARKGRLTVGKGDDLDVFDLLLGTVDPIDTDEGLLDRLDCLGFDVSQGLGPALKDFQTKVGLEPTGTPDDEVRDQLKERFGQ